MSKRNAQVSSFLTKTGYVKGRANMILERDRDIFIKKDIGFCEVNFFPREQAKLLKNVKKFLQAFISSLGEEDKVINESKMSNIKGSLFQEDWSPFGFI